MRSAHILKLALLGLAGGLAHADPLPPSSHAPSQPCPAWVAAGEGTLQEVFGIMTGYKDSTFIFAGERHNASSMDLLFHGGMVLESDIDHESIELTILQRGQNTHLQIQGLFPGGTLTDPIFLPRAMTTNQRWSLNTLELSGLFAPAAPGTKLDQSWSGVAGFRLTALGNQDTPDIFGGGCPAVPAPGALLFGSLGGFVIMRRRVR